MLRIRDHVTLQIRAAWAGPETVTCVIPGHEQGGEELIAEELLVNEGPSTPRVPRKLRLRGAPRLLGLTQRVASRGYEVRSSSKSRMLAHARNGVAA
jgi:hypothetical protein